MCALYDPVTASDNEHLQALFGLRLPEAEGADGEGAAAVLDAGGAGGAMGAADVSDAAAAAAAPGAVAAGVVAEGLPPMDVPVLSTALPTAEPLPAGAFTRARAANALPLPDGAEAPGGAAPAALAALAALADLHPLLLPATTPAPGEVGALRWGLPGLRPPVVADPALATGARVCRVEGMKSAPACRESWWAGRRCIVPARALFDWGYQGGRPELWNIQRADGQPLALAGLWAERPGPDGQLQLSFCLLSLAAQGHAIFEALSPPDQEKRMPVILPAEVWLPWLHGSLKDAERLLQRLPADQLQKTPRTPAFKAPREPKSWANVPDMFAYEWHLRAVEGPVRRPLRARRAPGPLPLGVGTAAATAELALPTTGSLF